MHLGIALAGLVLGRTRRGDDGGVHHGAGLEHQAMLGQASVDGAQHLWREFVLLQQVPEPQDGGLVGHAGGAFEADEATVQRPLMQLLLHGRIAQVPPQLKAVDAQHGLDGKWWSPAQRLVRAARMRLNQGDKRRPRHDLIHLVEEDLLAGLLGQRVQAKRHLIHTPHRPTPSSRAPVGTTRGFADLP